MASQQGVCWLARVGGVHLPPSPSPCGYNLSNLAEFVAPNARNSPRSRHLSPRESKAVAFPTIGRYTCTRSPIPVSGTHCRLLATVRGQFLYPRLDFGPQYRDFGTQSIRYKERYRMCDCQSRVEWHENRWFGSRVLYGAIKRSYELDVTRCLSLFSYTPFAHSIRVLNFWGVLQHPEIVFVDTRRKYFDICP